MMLEVFNIVMDAIASLLDVVTCELHRVSGLVVMLKIIDRTFLPHACLHWAWTMVVFLPSGENEETARSHASGEEAPVIVSADLAKGEGRSRHKSCSIPVQ